MVKELRSLKDLTAYVSFQKKEGRSIGFVPTMGALHEGHMSLVNLSKGTCDVTIASIYVNPSQFNESDDFNSYPREEENDLLLLDEYGCDAVFIPNRIEIESLNKIKVDLGELAEIMEGKHRPGHFDGVVEVVYRLFCAVTPDYAFFGEKDYQQIMVVQKMIETAGLPVKVVGGPIVREDNGLAMSSRNARLSLEIKAKAGFIFEGIKSFGTKDRIQIEREFAAAGFELEYLEEHGLNGQKRVFIAGVLEGVRLIDNHLISDITRID